MSQLSLALEAYLVQVEDHLPPLPAEERQALLEALRAKLNKALEAGLPEAELLEQMGDAQSLAATWSEAQAPSLAGPNAPKLRLSATPLTEAAPWPQLQRPRPPSWPGLVARACAAPWALGALAVLLLWLGALHLRHEAIAPELPFQAAALLAAAWPHLLAWWLPTLPVALGAFGLPRLAAQAGPEAFARLKLPLAWGLLALGGALGLLGLGLLEGPGPGSALRVEQRLTGLPASARPFSLPPSGLGHAALAEGMATLRAKLQGPHALPPEAWEGREVLLRRHARLQVAANVRLSLPALGLASAALGLVVGLLLVQRPWAPLDARRVVAWGAWGAVGAAMLALAGLAWLAPQAPWGTWWAPVALLWLPGLGLTALAAWLEGARRLGRSAT